MTIELAQKFASFLARPRSAAGRAYAKVLREKEKCDRENCIHMPGLISMVRNLWYADSRVPRGSCTHKPGIISVIMSWHDAAS